MAWVNPHTGGETAFHATPMKNVEDIRTNGLKVSSPSQGMHPGVYGFHNPSHAGTWGGNKKAIVEFRPSDIHRQTGSYIISEAVPPENIVAIRDGNWKHIPPAKEARAVVAAWETCPSCGYNLPHHSFSCKEDAKTFYCPTHAPVGIEPVGSDDGYKKCKTCGKQGYNVKPYRMQKSTLIGTVVPRATKTAAAEPEFDDSQWAAAKAREKNVKDIPTSGVNNSYARGGSGWVGRKGDIIHVHSHEDATPTGDINKFMRDTGAVRIGTTGIGQRNEEFYVEHHHPPSPAQTKVIVGGTQRFKNTHISNTKTRVFNTFGSDTTGPYSRRPVVESDIRRVLETGERLPRPNLSQQFHSTKKQEPVDWAGAEAHFPNRSDIPKNKSSWITPSNKILEMPGTHHDIMPFYTGGQGDDITRPRLANAVASGAVRVNHTAGHPGGLMVEHHHPLTEEQQAIIYRAHRKYKPGHVAVFNNGKSDMENPDAAQYVSLRNPTAEEVKRSLRGDKVIQKLFSLIPRASVAQHHDGPFYHGTTETRAKHIVEHGFDASDTRGGQAGIWLTRHLPHAQDYAGGKAKEDGDKPAIVRVDGVHGVNSWDSGGMMNPAKPRPGVDFQTAGHEQMVVVNPKAIVGKPVIHTGSKPKPTDALAASVVDALDDHLRRKPWKGDPNPIAGHCYVASEAMYHLMGGKECNYKPMHVSHEGQSHWYLQHKGTGEPLDLTANQFSTPVPYHEGRGTGFLTSHPSKRAAEVIEKVKMSNNDGQHVSSRKSDKVATMHDPIRSIAMLYVAHDSGDGQTIYHCPFCGSGQVVGRSDSTVECSFCNTHFTVQVQPEFMAQPQTVDGAGQTMPGMPHGSDPITGEVPGEGDEAGMIDPEGEGQDEEEAEGETNPDANPFPPKSSKLAAGMSKLQQHMQDSHGWTDWRTYSPSSREYKSMKHSHETEYHGTWRSQQDHQHNEIPDPGTDRDMRSTASYYLTNDGGVLSEEAYMKHLALHMADDPNVVLADIRKANLA